ncbi:hypothetical protein K438DRAFT_2092176 [Mycena galopus ATCC 62051]|nr:hypothetical protein K438DRAFT_2092176 [Mycena galopus ATCC 62051]
MAPGNRGRKRQRTVSQAGSTSSVASKASVIIKKAAKYLTEPRLKGVTNVLKWWSLNATTSVYVEHQFSRGRLLVSSVRNRLSAHSIRELICFGCWSRQGFVEDNDFKVVTSLPTVEEQEEEETGDEVDD